MDRFSKRQLAALWIFGLIWLACNASWVWHSGDYVYLYVDSLVYINAFNELREHYLSIPWWTWDIPPHLSLFPLVTLTLSILFTDPFGTQNVALCFAVQALIILATYALVARLGRMLYGARTGCISALCFLSFYMVDCSARNFMPDGLLGLILVAFFCCSVRLQRRHYSFSACVWWAVALAVAIMAKWTAITQWLPLYLLYTLVSVWREQQKVGTETQGRTWGSAGAEVLFWVIIGLLISYLEYLGNVRIVTAIIGVGVTISVLRSQLERMPVLRRFLIITGLILSVSALMWLKAQDDARYQYLVSINAIYSGSLVEHIVQEWAPLIVDTFNLLSNGVLLPIAYFIFLGCCIISLVNPRKYLPNVTFLGFTIIPGVCINLFFFFALEARYFMALLGLFAIIIGSVLAQGKRWIAVTLLSWCILAKLIFMAGWWIAPDFPEASDNYLQCDSMVVFGVASTHANSIGSVLNNQLHLRHYWADSLLFTASPHHPRDLERMYDVCKRQQELNRNSSAPILNAVVHDVDPSVFDMVIASVLDEISARRGNEHINISGIGPNASLILLLNDFCQADTVSANTLVMMYRLGGRSRNLAELQRHVQTYFPDCWSIAEDYASEKGYDIAVLKIRPGMEHRICLLCQYPPTPLLPMVNINHRTAAMRHKNI